MAGRSAERALCGQFLRRDHVPLPGGQGAGHGGDHVPDPLVHGPAGRPGGRAEDAPHFFGLSRRHPADAPHHVAGELRLGVRLRQLCDLRAGLSGVAAGPAPDGGHPVQDGPQVCSAVFPGPDCRIVRGTSDDPVSGGQSDPGSLCPEGRGPAPSLLGVPGWVGPGRRPDVRQRPVLRPGRHRHRPERPAGADLLPGGRPPPDGGQRPVLVHRPAAAHRLPPGDPHGPAPGGAHRLRLLEQPPAPPGSCRRPPCWSSGTRGGPGSAACCSIWPPPCPCSPWPPPPPWASGCISSPWPC